MPSRTYETTHPWINFRPDFRKASHVLWMLLGAAESKCRHLAGAPLLPEVASEMHQIFLAKGALATTAIEGNTLEEADVRAYLRGDLNLPPSRQYLQQEIQNVVLACNAIGAQILSPQLAPLCPEEIRSYNHRILQDLPLREGVTPGEFRTGAVVVGGYRGAPAEDGPYLVEELCSLLADIVDPENPVLGKRFRTASGIVAAVVAHLYLVWIHPFDDGNGRTARLLEFRLLLEAGVPTPAAHLLSNHYNKTRSEYYRHLHEASQGEEGMLRFVEYALQGFVDELDEQIVLIRNQQLQTIWAHLVHEAFAGQTGGASRRRHDLVLALTSAGRPVEIKELRRLSPELVLAYADKTTKTLTRDLNDLQGRNLIVREGSRVQANDQIALSLLPRRRID